MNKIFFSIILSSVLSFGADWTSYTEAFSQQTKNTKMIMIKVIKDNCRYCIEMQEQVFDNLEMKKWLDKRFNIVKLEYLKDELPLGLKPIVTPTFYFINKKEKLIKEIKGAWNIEDFKHLTRNIK